MVLTIRIEERIAIRNAIACSLALGSVVPLGQSAEAQLLEKNALSLAAKQDGGGGRGRGRAQSLARRRRDRR
jgi:hypothetical protein